MWQIACFLVVVIAGLRKFAEYGHANCQRQRLVLLTRTLTLALPNSVGNE